MRHPLCKTPSNAIKRHQFDSRSHQQSQASHPDFGPTYARYFRPGVYSLPLRPHRATRDERAGAQGRVVRGSPRTRRTERIVRAFPGPGSGADGHHDRCPSRSGWADRRPIPPERRRASTQGSHLSPLTVRAPGSRGGTQGPLLRRTNRLDPWSRLAAPLPTGRRSIPKPGSRMAARRVRSPALHGRARFLVVAAQRAKTLDPQSSSL